MWVNILKQFVGLLNNFKMYLDSFDFFLFNKFSVRMKQSLSSKRVHLKLTLRQLNRRQRSAFLARTFQYRLRFIQKIKFLIIWFLIYFL